ncbi:DsbA family protein [Sphingomonas sp.]|uniref:DsbA family protein n=1 Tax=Sphingomonas sp. TaxID=28214 RepID=UPI001DFFEE6D|nr:DsbA family protein [Sphingomonas sp.]MBX9796615.1 DsbA family protein [Sphingomonas sp.]
MILVALVAGLIGAGAVAGVHRLSPAAAGKGDARQYVKDYLAQHPDVLVEAANAYRARDTAKLVGANRAAIVTPFGNAWAGNPRGDVTVVQYFDYNCGYCRRNLATLKQLIARDPMVRVVFRELPVLSQASEVAARYSLAAAQQGRFHQFHEALYGAGPVSEQTITQALRVAGVDEGAVDKVVSSARVDGELSTNIAMMQKLGMTGTPSWVIGDQVVSSALSLAQLQAMVADARSQRRAG